MLSTSQTALVQQHGWTYLELNLRSTPDTCFVAGETTWVAYVLNDILLVATRNATCYAAPIASALIRMATRQCTIGFIDIKLSCQSARVHIGRWQRFLLHLILQCGGGASRLRFALVWKRHRQPAKAPLLLHGVAEPFYQANSFLDGVWELDDTSCVLSGLLPFSFRGHHLTFDVKLWVLVDNVGPVQQARGSTSMQSPASAKKSLLNFDSMVEAVVIEVAVVPSRSLLAKCWVLIGSLVDRR
ncbi:Aste57867_10156 [Aphanomyces stellatus]|uniref:Aste57867_10156 protein n=1 Tax=Aphanomyces stellatus TaxID=120398 RepID=A0A485KPP2_9STRA|nr:hypothetical protein As57867_010117 [Aphanomyces stellatus]VFT87032.1 Aste57867_10156 [Aphanomyces stellatus]